MRIFENSAGQRQRLVVADLVNGGAETFRSLIDGPVRVVYSDPPWNPGNEKWWRRHAGEEPPRFYGELLDAWCRCVVACNSEHVFVEQSVNVAHKSMLLDAVKRCQGWGLPLLEEWTVQYGSPKRPNALLHFGLERLRADPSGLSGETMTRTVFEGVAIPAGATVADPCMGLGMTSRLAHERGWNCIGTELNMKRLDRTIVWLVRHGYLEVR